MAGGQLREAAWLPPPDLFVSEHPQVSTQPALPLPAAPGHSLGLGPVSLF